MKGIEPSSVAWKATALPLSYTRIRAAQVAAPARSCQVLFPPIGIYDGLEGPSDAEVLSHGIADNDLAWQRRHRDLPTPAVATSTLL